MFNAYSAKANDKILLLGEGNFSFSKDFVILNNISKELQTNIEVIATCKETSTEGFSEVKQNTIKFLIERGVSVIFNVDATNLKSHSHVNTRKYSKVIFNFPHVGGKMKIHLNRRLLQEIFSSASDVLEDGGLVVIALCDGQGGTEADNKRRHWHDSWQITEMAAQSDFILCHVERFNGNCFPNYVNVGYRSLDKSFHSDNAVVHVFKQRSPPVILNVDPSEWLKDVSGLRKDAVFKFLDQNMVNPFTSADSPSSYVFEKIREQLGDCTVFGSILDRCDSESSLNQGGHLNSAMSNVQNIYSKFNLEISTCGMFLLRVLSKTFIGINRGDFSISPVRCQIMVFTNESVTEFFNYISLVFSRFNPDLALNLTAVEESGIGRVVFSVKDCQNITLVESFTMHSTNCHVIHIDDLAQILFRLDDWRYLWNGIVSPFPGHTIFVPSSFYPRPHTFDLGVSVPIPLEKQFHEKFFLLLWLLAGDIIVKTELISTYFPSDRDLICYCYRISYKSFNAPLHRKRIIYIHEKIIAVIVSRLLKVNIT